MEYNCAMPGCKNPIEKSSLCKKHLRADMRVPDYVQKIGIPRVYEFMQEKKTEITSIDIIKKFDSDTLISMDVGERDRKVSAVGKFFRTLRENGYIVKTNRQQNSVTYDIVPHMFKTDTVTISFEEPEAAETMNTVITFGKYSGHSIGQVAQDDMPYLISMMSNAATPTEFKKALGKYFESVVAGAPVDPVPSRSSNKPREAKLPPIVFRSDDRINLEIESLRNTAAEQQKVIAILLKELKEIKAEIGHMKDAIKGVVILSKPQHSCPFVEAKEKVDEALGKLKND